MAVPIQIRFADIDMMGIVHNAVYFHYFEQARLKYFIGELGANWDWQSKGFIVAKNSIEYKFPLVLSDQPLVEITVDVIGTKSFSLSYKVYTKDKNERIHATGHSTMVCMNNLKKQTIEIPSEIRAFLEAQQASE